MIIVRGLLLIAIVFVPLATKSEVVSVPHVSENVQEQGKKKIGPVSSVFIGECLFAGMSGLATLKPEAFGAVMTIFTPLSMVNGPAGVPPVEYAVSLLPVVALGVYNMTVLDDEEISDQTVFARNMIGWHVVLAWAAGVRAVAPRQRERDITCSFHMFPSGPRMSFLYRFGGKRKSA